MAEDGGPGGAGEDSIVPGKVEQLISDIGQRDQKFTELLEKVKKNKESAQQEFQSILNDPNLDKEQKNAKLADASSKHTPGKDIEELCKLAEESKQQLGELETEDPKDESILKKIDDFKKSRTKMKSNEEFLDTLNELYKAKEHLSTLEEEQKKQGKDSPTAESQEEGLSAIAKGEDTKEEIKKKKEEIKALEKKLIDIQNTSDNLDPYFDAMAKDLQSKKTEDKPDDGDNDDSEGKLKQKNKEKPEYLNARAKDIPLNQGFAAFLDAWLTQLCLIILIEDYNRQIRPPAPPEPTHNPDRPETTNDALKKSTAGKDTPPKAAEEQGEGVENEVDGGEGSAPTAPEEGEVDVALEGSSEVSSSPSPEVAKEEGPPSPEVAKKEAPSPSRKLDAKLKAAIEQFENMRKPGFEPKSKVPSPRSPRVSMPALNLHSMALDASSVPSSSLESSPKPELKRSKSSLGRLN